MHARQGSANLASNIPFESGSCYPVWPRTHYVEQVHLKLRLVTASASQRPPHPAQLLSIPYHVATAVVLRGQNTQAANMHPNYVLRYRLINRDIALTVGAEDEAQDPTPPPTRPQGLFMK